MNSSAISSTRNQDQSIPKNPKKVLLQHHLLNNFHKKLIDINFCYISHKIFLSHTDIPEIVELCSRHPKTFKSIINRKKKIFMKPIISSISIKESKKKKNRSVRIVENIKF